MIMNARQHIYVKIMQFAAVLCQCVGCQEQRRGDQVHQREREEIEGAKSQVESREPSQEPHWLNLASQSKVDGLVTVVAAAKRTKETRAETEPAIQQANAREKDRE